MEKTGRYQIYFYGNEGRNVPCGYKLFDVYEGRKWAYFVRDWCKNEELNLKFKLKLSWWQERKQKSKLIT
jgi:hypothetical protein